MYDDSYDHDGTDFWKGYGAPSLVCLPRAPQLCILTIDYRNSQTPPPRPLQCWTPKQHSRTSNTAHQVHYLSLSSLYKNLHQMLFTPQPYPSWSSHTTPPRHPQPTPLNHTHNRSPLSKPLRKTIRLTGLSMQKYKDRGTRRSLRRG